MLRKEVKLRYRILQIFFMFLYVFIIISGIFFKTDLSENNDNDENSNKTPALVDSKGYFVVSDKEVYEAWIDLKYLRTRKKLETYKTLIMRKYSESEINKKNFLFWGSYQTYSDLEKDVGVLIEFTNVVKNYDRIYDKLFTIEQIIGEKEKTIYGIEPYLFENGYFDSDNSQIKLTIDLELQKILYNQLKSTVEERNAEGAVAIIMETKTGKVKASVSVYPWNMNYMGYIEPGSTLKPLLYGLMIDEKIIGKDDKYYSGKDYKPLEDTDYFIKEASGYGYGELDLTKAIAESSNIAIAQAMKKLLGEYSNDWFYQELLKLGLGRKTGIEFKGEIEGKIPVPDEWYKITPYQIAMGQGIGVTPIQLIASFNSIVNNGFYVKPTFLEDKNVYGYQFFSPDTANYIKNIMRYTTITGTAREVGNKGVYFGGKTGTAQKAKIGVGYDNENYYSLFAGFYPVTDPKYTILVIVDSPKGQYYGGDVAAPVVESVFRSYEMGNENTQYLTKEFFKDVMPNLINSNIADALNIMNKIGFSDKKIIIKGDGDTIISQYPSPGEYGKNFDYIEFNTGWR